MRRLREAVIKCIILNGIPSAFEALMAVGREEKDEDKDFSFSREGWQPDKVNFDRGMRVLEFLYRDEHARIMSLFDAHRDLRMRHALCKLLWTETDGF